MESRQYRHLVRDLRSLLVFDAYRFFEPLNGRSFIEVRDLLRAVAEVRVRFLADLPSDFDVTELLELARRKQWLTEDAEGRLHFQVAAPAKSRKMEPAFSS
jgi:hypothetical protein